MIFLQNTIYILKNLFLVFIFSIFLNSYGFSQVLNKLEDISFEKEKEFSQIIFEFKEYPDYEILENLKQKIVVIKLRNVHFSNLNEKQFRNDPYLVFLGYENIKSDEVWIKIRVKNKNVHFKVLPQTKDSSQLRVLFHHKVDKDILLKQRIITKIYHKIYPDFDRITLDFNQNTKQYKISEVFEPTYFIHLKIPDTKLSNNAKELQLSPSILSSIETKQVGQDVEIKIFPLNEKQFGIEDLIYIEKNQLIVNLYEKINSDEDIAFIKKQPTEEALELYLDEKLAKAEHLFLKQKLRNAANTFKHIYNIAPKHEIGLKANYRVADSYFQLQLNEPKPAMDHFVIQQYVEAINTEKETDIITGEIPRALYNIGRSYENMQFFDESMNYYNELIRNYPNSAFSKDARFKLATIELQLGRYDEAIQQLTLFKKDYPEARQIPQVNYRLGQSYYSIKEYEKAKKYFDEARTMAPKFPYSDINLLFQIGETYYENQQFDTARFVYEMLLEKFPKHPLSQFVAIRIGDFLKQAGKEKDAIIAYKNAIIKYPKELNLIGEMRIANIYAKQPNDESYQKALDIYDKILEKHLFSKQAEEAFFRKGLTLSLFGKPTLAIETLQEFSKKYPENRYVLTGIVQQEIIKNIDIGIKTNYYNERYLDILNLFEKYKKPYLPFFSDDMISMIGDAYQELGLPDKAIILYDEIVAHKEASNKSLALLNKAKSYRTLENYQKEQETLVEFLQNYSLNVQTPEVLQQLGDSYRKTNEIKKALQAYKLLIARNKAIDILLSAPKPLDKNNPSIQESLNLFYLNEKNTPKSWDKEKSVLFYKEMLPLSWYSVGNLYEDQGDYNKALHAYEETIHYFNHSIDEEKVIPYIKDTYFLIPNMHYELKQFSQALKHYKKAIQLYPKDPKTPWAEYQIAQIYQQSGENEKALEMYQTLTEKAEQKMIEEEKEPLWAKLATQSKQDLENQIQFNDYLNREPSAN